MTIIVNSTGVDYLENLIRDGEVNTSSSWSFTTSDGNALLGAGDDWENYAKHHLAVDTEAERETKARFKYPVAKGSTVYRRGVIAAKARASAQGATNIADAADRLLQMIDADQKSFITVIMSKIRTTLKLDKQVNLNLPDHMVANLRRGVELHEAGRSGSGLKPQTVREAKNMIKTGRVTNDKAIRASAWLARHASDKTPEWNKRGAETPGFVAHLLWASNGDGRAKAWFDRKRDQTQAEEKEVPPTFFVTKEMGTDNYRWFGWVTNKFEDREGEILTDMAHREFLQFLNANPDQAPELWIWHTPGSARKARADWWDYKHGFFMYSGVLTEEEAKQYITTTNEPMGMSHGFYVLEQKGNLITRYRTFEVSELPLDMAANPYTNFAIKEAIKEMFDQRRRAFLVDRLGEDAVANIEANTEGFEKALEDAGTNWKSLNEQYDAQVEAEFANAVAEATKEAVGGIVEQVIEALNVKGLQDTLQAMHSDIEANKTLVDRIVSIEEKVQHLMETEDARVAKAITPPEPFDWFMSATKSQDNVVSETEIEPEVKEQVQNATGKLDWLSNLNPYGVGGD